jgi:site-specific recombinase XerD
MGKNQRIKNKNYRQFLDTGVIQNLEQPDIEIALNKVSGIYAKQGRALIIYLYFTGARPAEAFKTICKDFTRIRSFVKVNVPAAKGGLPRTVFLKYTNPLVRELYKYAQSLFDDQRLFWKYANSYKRPYTKKNGEEIFYEQTSDKLRYYFKKWFDHIDGGISPYFLRHNRMSKLSERGASLEDIRQFKGARSFESVYPYLHMNTKTAKSLARRID